MSDSTYNVIYKPGDRVVTNKKLGTGLGNLHGSVTGYYWHNSRPEYIVSFDTTIDHLGQKVYSYIFRDYELSAVTPHHDKLIKLLNDYGYPVEAVDFGDNLDAHAKESLASFLATAVENLMKNQFPDVPLNPPFEVPCQILPYPKMHSLPMDVGRTYTMSTDGKFDVVGD